LATRPTVMSAWRPTAMSVTSPQQVAQRCFEGHEGSFSTTRPCSRGIEITRQWVIDGVRPFLGPCIDKSQLPTPHNLTK
jgi:hypothetical protein